MRLSARTLKAIKMSLKNFSRNKIRLIIFLAGVAMILLGIERGEVSTIFDKASRVCLECIGLG